MPPPTWLIDTIIPAGGLAAMYGEPGSGKTFIALDMALSVATGAPWQGHTCDRGYVLYISAEGGNGIGKRVRAWLQARGHTARQANVAWLIESIPVHGESDQVDRLIKRISREVDTEPSLIVVDTLARCFDGDENQQQDMGRFIQGIDKLRLEWGAAALVIHHTRLAGDRERGNTAFRGAADTMLSVHRAGQSGHARRTNGLTLSCNKQKDAEEFEPIGLKLVPVGETDSCVIQEGEMIVDPDAKRAKVLSVLTENGGQLQWSEWLSLTGLPKATFGRIVRDLRSEAVIIGQSGVYRLL